MLRVTELIHAPLVKKLLLDNWKTLEQDASESLLTLIGNGVHTLLEKSDKGNVDTELEIRIPIPGFKVVLKGSVDRVDWGRKLLEDYKCLGVMAYIFGKKKGFPDYTDQLNVYRWMIRKKFPEREIERIRLNLIFRDWKIRDARHDPENYPPSPFATADIDLWSEEQANKYVNQRLDLHLRREPRPCNDEERWHSPDCYAVKSKTKKAALAATDPTSATPISSMERALQIIDERGLTSDYKCGKVYVQHRPGQDTKCQDWCVVRSVCPFNKYNAPAVAEEE